MKYSVRSAFAAALALAPLTIVSVPLSAAVPDKQASVRELVVGTKEAPHFAIKDDNGNWSGISIELWRKVADRLKLRYRIVDVISVQSLLENLQTGDLDIAVAAITITPAWQEVLDFSMPYFHTGTGIAVQANRITSWEPVIRSIASSSFLQAAMGLLGLAFLSGTLIWLFERRSNEKFGGGAARGISSGVWVH